MVRPRPGYVVLAGVGGATDSMTRGLAIDLAPIRVNVISPGLVRTEVSLIQSASFITATYTYTL